MHTQRATASTIQTPFGTMLAVAINNALAALRFAEHHDPPTDLNNLANQLAVARIDPATHPIHDAARDDINRYADDPNAQPHTPLAPVGTPFQRAAWDALRAIPPGQTRSYAEQAAAMRRPNAARAVGRANAANPIAILIPCHRVIGSAGDLTGYAAGLQRKRRLLDHELTARTLFAHAAPR